MTKAAEFLDQLVTSSVAAACINVTPRRLRQLESEGWFKPVNRGFWRLGDVLHGYARFLKEENERRSKVAGESELKKARAREIELRIAREDRKVISLEEHDEVVDLMAGVFLEALGGMPARITRDQRERQRLESIFASERQRISDRFAEIAANLHSADGASEADAEDDAG